MRVITQIFFTQIAFLFNFLHTCVVNLTMSSFPGIPWNIKCVRIEEEAIGSVFGDRFWDKCSMYGIFGAL